MQNVIIFGAGRSSLFLVEYLSSYCNHAGFNLKVCDKDTAYAKANCRVSTPIEFIEIDIFDQEKLQFLIPGARLVVSLLPAALHIHIAELCLAESVSLATASYISDEMKALHEQVVSNDLMFLNECGLDPGIDHMSAMQMMDEIRKNGAEITGFESYCGGLMADDSDGDNPWKYKFTWNPRNVVVAGQGAPAQYLEEGQLKLLPYHHLFKRVESFDINGYGILEGYPNRDSLKYQELYGLDHVSDMIRGTLRKPGYCAGWQVFVDLGMTDDNTRLEHEPGTSMNDWLASYLPPGDGLLAERVRAYANCSDVEIAKLDWLGLFGDGPLPLYKGTSAQILEEVLKEKWKLMDTDRDLVVMVHRIKYRKEGKLHTHLATMVLEGESSTHTAMAKTVGLPLAIACKLILEGNISIRGVITPVMEEFYEPVLRELETFGIHFKESLITEKGS